MKRIRHFLILSTLFLGWASTSFGQDIHFSQFYQSPLNLNPAMTGVMNCNVRFVANYRNQWASVLRANAFNTYSVSYDQKFTAFRRDYFGVGATFWGDRAGEVSFSTLQGRISGSFSKYLGGNRSQAHYLVVGVDGGLAQRSIDFANARYGNQNVDGVFNGSIASGEEGNWERNNFLFGDLSAGILWFSNWGDNRSFYAGGAYHHINSPNQSFSEDQEVFLYSRYTLHAGGEFPISRRTSLVPGMVTFFQGPSWQLNGGTSMRFELGSSRYDNQSFQFGAWVRLVNQYQWNTEMIEDYSLGADAIILSTRFQYNNFDFGFSYDVNVSPLRTGANGNGAFEFSMIYTICGPEKRGVYCPVF